MIRKIPDIWGGLASMLVAFPQSIAFGIIVFSVLGRDYVSIGAISGAIGAIIVGIVAPLLGGTPRLISSPCAPSAAFLAGLLSEPWMSHITQTDPRQAIIIIGLTVWFAGLFQILFSFVGGGKVIKYIPYPVVTGYLSSVGIIIFLGQLPRLTGMDTGTSLINVLLSPFSWSPPAVIIGLSTIAVMYFSPRITKKIPAPLIGLFGGIVVYFLLSLFYSPLRSLSGNNLVIGALQGGFSVDFFQTRLAGFSGLQLPLVNQCIIAGATLAVVLSIDTLKTCVIVDTLGKIRSNTNRELFGQGFANFASGAAGGIAGAGTLGATLINLSSGGTTRLSGVLSGAFTLLAFVVFSPLLAWVPVPALAGILILVAIRTVDWNIFAMIKKRAAIFDLLVICGVIGVALRYSLITAAGTGFALSTIFFLREQIMSSFIRRKNYGGTLFSKKSRLSHETRLLREEGARTVIYEIQGNLFFGNTDRFFTAISEDLEKCQFVILNLRMVQSIDSTAVHTFDQVDSILSEKNGRLILAGVPHFLSPGQTLEMYLNEVTMTKHSTHILIFDELSDALEWAEDFILNEKKLYRSHLEKPLYAYEIEIFRNLSPDRLTAIKSCLDEKSYNQGEKIFSSGDTSDEIYFIRRGIVRIILPIDAQKTHHLATFGAGDFFGDMSFVDHEKRSADAVAESDVDLFLLSRKRFDELVKKDPGLAADFYKSLTKVLAIRFRSTHLELRSLE